MLYEGQQASRSRWRRPHTCASHRGPGRNFHGDAARKEIYTAVLYCKQSLNLSVEMLHCCTLANETGGVKLTAHVVKLALGMIMRVPPWQEDLLPPAETLTGKGKRDKNIVSHCCTASPHGRWVPWRRQRLVPPSRPRRVLAPQVIHGLFRTGSCVYPDNSDRKIKQRLERVYLKY